MPAAVDATPFRLGNLVSSDDFAAGLSR